MLPKTVHRHCSCLGSRASLADALPLHIAPRWFSSHSGFKCPICSKSVASDEMEMHFIMCLSKPRLSYNDDVLTKDAGECVICLEELLQGDTIARLPCLCIYHKRYGRATRARASPSEIPEGSFPAAGGEKGGPSSLAIRSPLVVG